MDIVVENISKSFGKQAVLRNISFRVAQGETVGIVGPNGCGKSTLLSILAGIDSPDGGRIVFSVPGGRSKSGYLPQINPLIEQASIYDNIRLWAPGKREAEELLGKYRLYDIRRKKVSKLSGGMKRRLAIACALAHGPELLIMDEPTAALDIEYKSMIHEQMREFTRAGGSIILVTHEREEIEMCDRCYMLDGGNIRPYEGK